MWQTRPLRAKISFAMKLDARALIGRTLNDTYRLVRSIGSGGMGAILEAQSTRLHHKRFAVKMLHPSLAMDPETFQRFRREAEIASSLGHDHIIEVHDFNVTPEGEPYMVMEYLDGEDLAGRIKARGPMSLGDTAAIVAQVASALEAAHAAGIVHRDLKPQNIFLCKRLGRDDFVKVLDFGVSKMRHSSSVVTQDHSLLGTPYYMSPEQADGRIAEIDGRTDVFALGAIVYEMLTGQMAFYAETPMSALYKVVHVEPPELAAIRPDVPHSVAAVVRRALAKSKANRYESAADLSGALNEAVGATPGAFARPASVPGTHPSMAFAHTATPAPASLPAPYSLPPRSSLSSSAPLPPPATGSIATMSRATGQVIDTTPPRRSRALVWAVAIVAVAAGAGGVMMVSRGRDPGPSPVVPAGSPTAPAPPAPTPAQTAPEPPKAPAQPPAKVEPPPAPAPVTLNVEVSPAKAKATIKVNGKRAVGPALSLPRGTDEVTVEVDAPGYVPVQVRVVPDGDKPVPVTLRPKQQPSGSYNREFLKKGDK
jgi:serine/threonine-protein kinase